MSNYPMGAENDPNAPFNEVVKYNNCMYCGEPIENNGYCNTECEKADFND